MPWKLIFVFCGVVAVVMLVFYVRAGDSIRSIDVSCDNFTKQEGTVSQEIEVDTWSDYLIVSLCSNPTTGFQWELTELTDEKIVAHESNEYIPSEDKEIAGAPGQEVWTFRVHKAGACNITMEYGRPWEGGTKTTWKYDLIVVAK